MRENLLIGEYQQTSKEKLHEDVENAYGMFPVLAERQQQKAGFTLGTLRRHHGARRLSGRGTKLFFPTELDGVAVPRVTQLVCAIGHPQRVQMAGARVVGSGAPLCRAAVAHDQAQRIHVPFVNAPQSDAAAANQV